MLSLRGQDLSKCSLIKLLSKMLERKKIVNVVSFYCGDLNKKERYGLQGYK
jgi:hypothetical protein